MKKNIKINAPDLTQCPPRSPRVRLGGYAILPRTLDKGRATIIGKNGEFHFNCPLDQRVLEFAGIAADKLKKQLETGKGDGEILEWITKNSTTKPSLIDILFWSAYQDQRVPTDRESRQFFHESHTKMAPHREDIASWFDLLDIDDFVSFGGKA
ncbi:MAG: DUF5069 domain-containing protein [Verrucomicrobiota bacterium]|nr:DUF5069 domain-containing protein [Verrucomicrobiota bacterium]